MLEKQITRDIKLKKAKSKQMTKSLSIILNKDQIDTKLGLSNQYNDMGMMGLFKKSMKQQVAKKIQEQLVEGAQSGIHLKKFRVPSKENS